MDLDEKTKVALDKIYQQDVSDLEVAKITLEGVYRVIPATIAHVAELTGIPESSIVECAVAAAWHHPSVKWYQVIDIMRSFYLAKKSLEEKQP